ncbi:MAG: DUF2769 domain-containing protein [Thermodesulfobacteriota bacterium]
MGNLDKFNVESMTKEEHEQKKEYVIKNCKCPGCPSYVEGDSPVGYCFPLIGTSKKIQWEKECICESCPIWKEYDLGHTFYCTRCSEVCQTMKTEVEDAP